MNKHEQYLAAQPVIETVVPQRVYTRDEAIALAAELPRPSFFSVIARIRWLQGFPPDALFITCPEGLAYAGIRDS